MDILTPNNWLKDYLKTNATPSDIFKYLSLCGPSVDKIIKYKNESIYQIEVTTNRVDSASVYGIAREASAILPRFGIEATLLPVKLPTGYHFISKVKYLDASIDNNLCQRFSAVLIKNCKISQSPSWVRERLKNVGIRPLNNIVDISNYIMVELGQPMHTFDYDKIMKAKMILRKSKPKEIITTLDKQTYTLKGGDIIIEDGDGRIIDLAGIMGGVLSAVDENTKNVLLFVQTYNPTVIRRTSMNLAKRTEASVLFEKGLDPELVTVAIKRGIYLFRELTGGSAEKNILDIYAKPYKKSLINVDFKLISDRLGTEIKPSLIKDMLTPLGFEIVLQKKYFKVSVPSWRSKDIQIPEDILEEVARIYGYFRLSSEFMKGALPEKLANSPFDFEYKLKTLLKGWGMNEIYTSTLVPREFCHEPCLKLKNPLGDNSEYLRNNLRSSLINAVNQNLQEKEPFSFFEMANVFLSQGRTKLPQEKMMLAGIFKGYTYRKAKGIVEALLSSLYIKAELAPDDLNNYKPGQCLLIKNKGIKLGLFGVLEENNLIYFEFDLSQLQKASRILPKYKPLPKYPAQIEDITFNFPTKTKIGEVIDYIDSYDKISAVNLKDIYKNSFSLRVNYLDPKKTLTNDDVRKIRENIIRGVRKKFGGIPKE